MVFSPRLFSALVSAGFSRVTLLLDVPDRWIIHNPECMELLLGLNPPCWMTRVMFPGSGVNRMRLSYTIENTSTATQADNNNT